MQNAACINMQTSVRYRCYLSKVHLKDTIYARMRLAHRNKQKPTRDISDFQH